MCSRTFRVSIFCVYRNVFFRCIISCNLSFSYFVCLSYHCQLMVAQILLDFLASCYCLVWSSVLVLCPFLSPSVMFFS